MPNQLKEIAPGVYEGMSPARKEVRRFIKLPDDLSEDEMLSIAEEVFDAKTAKESWGMGFFRSYNEVIDGETYTRFLADANIETLQKKAQAVERRLNELRSEKGGEVKK